MADILIRGMKMPMGCAECRLNNDTICVLINSCIYDESNGYTRRPDCPLTALPEGHGRLGDLDDLAAGCDAPNWCRWLSEIEDQPTIVPADKDGAK